MCLKTTHRLVALTAWLAVSPPTPLPLLAGSAVAFATGGGALSPDCDIWLPFLGHRKTTHLIELPIVALIVALGLRLNGASLWWLLAAAATAWLSHLILDIFSGKRGVPSLLFGRLRVTAWLWMHTGGWFELRIFRPLILPLALVVTIAVRVMLYLGVFPMSLFEPLPFPSLPS